MGKTTTSMELIESEKKRLMTFNKRSSVLLKKAYELSTLCEIPLCVIIYGPNGEPPSVWPEDPQARNLLVTRYMNTTLEERQKRCSNLTSMQRKNRKDENMDTVEDDKENESLPRSPVAKEDVIKKYSREELIEVASRLDDKIARVRNRIDAMKLLNPVLTNFEALPINQYHENEDQKSKTMMMLPMNDMEILHYQNQIQNQNQNRYQNQYQHPSVRYYNQHLEEQKRNAEALTTMRTMNDGGYFNPNNIMNNNVNVGDCNNGLIERNMQNGSQWYCPNNNTQLQLQPQQFSGTQFDQFPFRNEQ